MEMIAARGVLNARPSARHYQLSLHPPADDLALFVEQYWIVAWDLRGRAPYCAEVLSHPCVHLVFERGKTGVFGVVRGKFSRPLEGAGRVCGVKFRPGAFYPFAGRPVSTFTDRTLSLEEVFGVASAPLEDAVLSLDTTDAMIARVEAFLRAQSPERDEHAAAIALIQRIIERIIADRALVRVDDVARVFALTPRALQRLFSQYVGVSPKWVIKRYRLHEAAERLERGAEVDIAQLALALGYCDQAHFINDFRALVGATPAAYVRRAESSS